MPKNELVCNLCVFVFPYVVIILSIKGSINLNPQCHILVLKMFRCHHSLSNKRLMTAFLNCLSHLREALTMYTQVTQDVMRMDI